MRFLQQFKDNKPIRTWLQNRRICKWLRTKPLRRLLIFVALKRHKREFHLIPRRSFILQWTSDGFLTYNRAWEWVGFKWLIEKMIVHRQQPRVFQTMTRQAMMGDADAIVILRCLDYIRKQSYAMKLCNQVHQWEIPEDEDNDEQKLKDFNQIYTEVLTK